MTVECTCKKWKEWQPVFKGRDIVLLQHNMPYEGPVFAYCPWCGKKLKEVGKDLKTDDVNHPEHYNKHPSGVECIDIIEHMAFNPGTAVKYIWRAGLKDADVIKDLRKAEWYIKREIERIGKDGKNQ